MFEKKPEARRSTPVPETGDLDGDLRESFRKNKTVFLHGSAGLTKEDALKLDGPFSRLCSKARKAADATVKES